jgi:hypothetical protein
MTDFGVKPLQDGDGNPILVHPFGVTVANGALVDYEITAASHTWTLAEDQYQGYVNANDIGPYPFVAFDGTPTKLLGVEADAINDESLELLSAPGDFLLDYNSNETTILDADGHLVALVDTSLDGNIQAARAEDLAAAQVPEPSSWALLMLGVIALWMVSRLMATGSRTPMKSLRKVDGPAGLARWRMMVAGAAFLMGTAAQATDYNETVSGDLSNDPAHPTVLSSPLTLGDNRIIGSTIPSGPVIDPTGALAIQDNDYVNFTVPSGYLLTAIDSLSPGTSLVLGDRLFLGIAQGFGVSLNGPEPASGLLGWTLVGQSYDMNGNLVGKTYGDFLPDLGSSAPANFPDQFFPGATGFAGALSAGDYTLWMLDGDHPAYYDLDLVVTRVPEPSVWMLMIAGVASIVAMRTRRSPRPRRADGPARVLGC